MIYSEDITFNAAGETLAGTIDWNANKDKPTILSLHGGAEPAKARAAHLTKALAENGYSCLRFDFSGFGQSTGERKQGSLAKRLQESLKAIELLDQTKPITLIGTSMGGATAMELTRHLKIENIILFCPALYAAEAFDVPFDDRFTEILRSKNSFLRTDTALLESYTGKLLHFIGDQDGIIPEQVTTLYEKHSFNTKDSDFLTIENIGHQLHSLFEENTGQGKAIIGAIIDFIND